LILIVFTRDESSRSQGQHWSAILGPMPRTGQKSVASYPMVPRGNLETWRGENYDAWCSIQLAGSYRKLMQKWIFKHLN